MKTQSAEFITKEEGTQRQPAELYHIWKGSTHYRHTSGDVSIVYGGHTYTPAPIQRAKVSYNEKLEVNTLDITMSRVTEPASQFIAVIPTNLVWISVHKLHRDMLTEETTPIFIGQMKSVSFKGTDARVKCVGFEHFLNQVVPRYRYGAGCQHTLYDDKCTVDINNFTQTVEIDSISVDGLSLTAAELASQTNGYYTLGYLIFGDYSRMIISHLGGTIGLRYPIVTMVPGDTIIVSAGCDRSRITCEAKFNNLINQLGFPDIPVDNPATWT